MGGNRIGMLHEWNPEQNQWLKEWRKALSFAQDFMVSIVTTGCILNIAHATGTHASKLKSKVDRFTMLKRTWVVSNSAGRSLDKTFGAQRECHCTLCGTNWTWRKHCQQRWWLKCLCCADWAGLKVTNVHYFPSGANNSIVRSFFTYIYIYIYLMIVVWSSRAKKAQHVHWFATMTLSSSASQNLLSCVFPPAYGSSASCCEKQDWRTGSFKQFPLENDSTWFQKMSDIGFNTMRDIFN